MNLDRETVLAFRRDAQHLNRKLPADDLAVAAAPGLQDSAPRSAIVSLHARAHDVAPSSWEDPALVQIWGPRGADYVVPRSDLGIFTLGRLPRDANQIRALDELTDAVHKILDGRTLRAREVYDALPGMENPYIVRTTAITGRVLIRWDASMIWLIACDAPDVDPEDARRELARRFVQMYGPTTLATFAWWAGIDERDARETWKGIETELLEIDLEHRKASIFADDVDRLGKATREEAVRLLPVDDPYLKIDRDTLVPDEGRRALVFPKVSRGFIPGSLLVDGEIVGAWGRKQGRITIYPFDAPTAKLRELVEAEAHGFPIATRSPISVEWAADSCT